MCHSKRELLACTCDTGGAVGRDTEAADSWEGAGEGRKAPSESTPSAEHSDMLLWLDTWLVPGLVGSPVKGRQGNGEAAAHMRINAAGRRSPQLRRWFPFPCCKLYIASTRLAYMNSFPHVLACVDSSRQCEG